MHCHFILKPPCYYLHFADNGCEVFIRPFPHPALLARCPVAWALGQPTLVSTPSLQSQPGVWAGPVAPRPVATPCFSPVCPPSPTAWVARQLPRLVMLPPPPIRLGAGRCQPGEELQLLLAQLLSPLRCSVGVGQGVGERQGVSQAQNC